MLLHSRSSIQLTVALACDLSDRWFWHRFREADRDDHGARFCWARVGRARWAGDVGAAGRSEPVRGALEAWRLTAGVDSGAQQLPAAG
jgi:hypothetical protein